MAFIISKAPHPSSSEATDQKKNGEVSVSAEAQSSITRHVYLKSSSADRQAAAAAALDKDVVLRRIRHHKNLIKVRTAFQALLGGSSSSEEAASSPTTKTSAHEAWLLGEDIFSSP